MDEITCAAVGDDGSIVVAGNTDDGLYDHPLAPSHQDFTATKLDADGNMLWQWKVGNSIDTRPEASATRAVVLDVFKGFVSACISVQLDLCQIDMVCCPGRVEPVLGATSKGWRF